MHLDRAACIEAAAALVAAGYVHGVTRLAGSLVRRRRFPRRAPLVFAGLLPFIVSLGIVLPLLDRLEPGMGDPASGAVLLGMAVGTLLPGGRGSGVGFGAAADLDDGSGDDTGNDGDGDSGAA